MATSDQLAALLERAAERLLLEGFPVVARALGRASLTIAYGDSWWDGHDDYFYDVRLTLAAPQEQYETLAAAGSYIWDLVRKSFGESLVVFDGKKCILDDLSLVPVDATR